MPSSRSSVLSPLEREVFPRLVSALRVHPSSSRPHSSCIQILPLASMPGFVLTPCFHSLNARVSLLPYRIVILLMCRSCAARLDPWLRAVSFSASFKPSARRFSPQTVPPHVAPALASHVSALGFHDYDTTIGIVHALLIQPECPHSYLISSLLQVPRAVLCTRPPCLDLAIRCRHDRGFSVKVVCSA